MVATVVEGIITVITFGLVPSSTATIYYVDLSRYGTPPQVGWFFNDDCQTFSSTAPVIPVGDIAPPYTPGGTPPSPTSPDYPERELPDLDQGPEPFADTVPMSVAFHADAATSATVTGTGATYVEVASRMRTRLDVRDICAVRLHAHVSAANAALTLVLCASVDDGTTWLPLSPAGTGPQLPLGATGTLVGLFTNIDPAYAGNVLVNVCVQGDGTATIGNLYAWFFVKSSEGVCIPIDEPSGGCGLFGTANLGRSFIDYADYAALVTDLPMGGLITTFGPPATEDANFAEFLTDGGGPHLALYHNKTGSARNLRFITANLINWGAAALMVTSIDPALADAASGTGLVLFRFNAILSTIIEVQLRGGRIWLHCMGDAINVGPASDLCDGTPKQVILTAAYFNDSNLWAYGANLYIDEPCLNAAPTFYAGNYPSLISGTQDGGVFTVTANTWDGTELTGTQKVYAYSVSEDKFSFYD